MAATSSTFATVLVARKPQDQPSELELQLRQEARKCRVVERLSGGAHVLFPGSETTIALRAYYPSHLAQLDVQHDENDALLLNRASAAAGVPPPPRINKDDLEAFRDAFKYPIVFFILPPQMMMDQLSKADSFVAMAQQIMNDSKQRSVGNAKTFVVPDTKSVIDTVLILLDALHPERRKLREKYYEHTRSLHFLPDDKGNVVDPTNQMATHVSTEIRSLADNLQFGAGEAEILMNRLGTLHKIATADHCALTDIPLDDASKEKLHNFFGTEANPKTTQQPQVHHHTSFYNPPQQRDAAHVPTHGTDNGIIHDNHFDAMPNYNEFTSGQSQNQFMQHDEQGYNQFTSDASQTQLMAQNQFDGPYQFETQNQFEQPVAAAHFQGLPPQQHYAPAHAMTSRPHQFFEQHNGGAGYLGNNNVIMMDQQLPQSYRPTSQWNHPPTQSVRPYSRAPRPQQHYSETPRPFSRFTRAPNQQRYPPSTTQKFARPQRTSRTSAIGQYFG